MENHASFIVFLLVLLLVWLRQTDNDRLAHAVWIALPFGWTLVFLSKQNIAAFAVAPLLLAGLLSLRDACDARVALRSLVLGTVFCLATVAALSTVAGIDPGIVWRDLFVEASQTGAGRFSYASLRAHVKYQFWTPHPVESQLLAGLVALLLLRLAWLLRQPTVRRQVLELLVPVSLMAASFVFVVTTANQHDNAWPYLFCFLGVLHAKSTLLLPTPWPNLGFRVLILLLAAGCVQYFAISNGERRFHDIVFEANAATQPRTEALRFMQLQTVPQLQRYTADDLDAVIDFLKSRSENFFLVGDSSFLYGVAGKPSVNPQLFFHSLMRPGVFTALRRRRYQEELFERFKRYNVGLIVLEGEQTWTEVDLAALTQLERFVRARTVRTHSFGSFKVLELRSTPTT